MAEKNVIDTAAGVERFSGNRELYESFLKRFPQESCFNQLEDALEKGETEAAFFAAHTLKGVAGNLSITSVYKCGAKLSDALKDNDLPAARLIFAEFKQHYAAACAAIKEYFG